MKYLLCAVLGGLVGSVLTVKLVEKHYVDRANEEIAKVQQHYRERAWEEMGLIDVNVAAEAVDSYKGVDDDGIVVTGDAGPVIPKQEQIDYTKFSKNPGVTEETTMGTGTRTRTYSPPEKITRADYDARTRGNEQMVCTYYMGDDQLTSVIDGHEQLLSTERFDQLIGRGNLEEFGLVTPEGEQAIYVRCEKFRMDLQVIKSTAAYGEDLNTDPDDEDEEDEYDFISDENFV